MLKQIAIVCAAVLISWLPVEAIADPRWQFIETSVKSNTLGPGGQIDSSGILIDNASKLYRQCDATIIANQIGTGGRGEGTCKPPHAIASVLSPNAENVAIYPALPPSIVDLGPRKFAAYWQLDQRYGTLQFCSTVTADSVLCWPMANELIGNKVVTHKRLKPK